MPVAHRLCSDALERRTFSHLSPPHQPCVDHCSLLRKADLGTLTWITLSAYCPDVNFTRWSYFNVRVILRDATAIVPVIQPGIT